MQPQTLRSASAKKEEERSLVFLLVVVQGRLRGLSRKAHVEHGFG